MVAGGLKGFSLIFSDVVVEPKQSEGMFDVFYLLCWSLWGTLNGTTESYTGFVVGE